MASVKPEVPAPEQPRARMAPGNPNLDQLQGMLNLVLLTAGRFIKEHQAGGGVGRMKQGLQRAVPAANERFNDALDELENEIRLAHVVLRRDLALLKQDRKKREAAAKQHEAERARAAAESRLGVPAKKEEVAVKPEAVTPAAASTEAPPPAEQLTTARTPEAAPKVEEDPAQPPVTETASKQPPDDPLFDATPANSNTQEHEFDFDFEFGDAMASGTNNDGDMMDTSGDMDFTLDEGPSLLRGLEDFANAKGHEDDNNGASTDMDLDFPMPDLPDMNSDAKPSVEQPKPAEPSQQPKSPADDAKESKPAKEAADTKPNIDSNDTTNNNDEPMETITTNNLDDLFYLDDYEDPEGGESAFDDAFFNFD
ncbi:uncharacterized protein M421DRAFT_5988 [Didymella exigua CBS 183.55]|uniref:Uncharacterized protein n=1 Tax=Didymella exigua CBS 183.55 TaxID=1150837 RepID=A0A6A5RKU0_9PLEO|nr:uncharacterized protein M421DRAFT_5988 [Didymella exigua CBS 183.55]KAF1927728.1 hypothetical protein M421DRAFT_5988 [Didymella exigua CBS 183.55]